MAYISLEKMIREDRSSMYKLVLMAAARANELAAGAKPLITTDAKKVTTLSLQEIAADKVSYEEDKK